MNENQCLADSPLFEITRLVINTEDGIPINENEFDEVKQAKTSLFESLFIEEKFDQLVESYLELEVELLQLAARHMVSVDFDYEKGKAGMSLINRRLQNLLSTCRVFIDHAKHHASSLFGKESAEYETFERSFKDNYDAHLAFRVMEALRNYSQHCDWAVTNTHWDIQPVGEDLSKIRFSISPKLRIASYEKDGNFKATVLEELKETFGDVAEIDLMLMVRKYLSCLAYIYKVLRVLAKDKVKKWEATFQGIL